MGIVPMPEFKDAYAGGGSGFQPPFVRDRVLDGGNTLVLPVAEGATRIEGRLVAGGVTCPLFRLGNGRVVALVGLPPELARASGRLALEGAFVKYSPCMQGAGTFQINKAARRR